MKGQLTVCGAQAVHCATTARGAALPAPGAAVQERPCSAGPEPAALPEVGQSGGHDKSELGTATGRPLDGDRPTMRLDQPLDDEQAEPGATTALGSPELAEDARHELGGDTVPLVTNRDRDRRPADRPQAAQAARLARGRARTAGATGGYGFDRLYHNRHRTSTVPDRVLHQIPEYLVHLVGVQPGLGKLAGDGHLEPLRRLPGGDPAGDYLLRPLGDADELAVDLHPAGLDAGHVQQLGDKPGDPVG